MHVLAALVLGLALLGGQCGSADRSEAASSVADAQTMVTSASRDDGGASEGCLPDGSEFVQVALSGVVQYNIEWRSGDMECGGFGNTVHFGGVPAGASSQVDLIFEIEVAEGATGTVLPARVQITDRASGRVFQTWEAGGCTASVTEHTLLDENPAFRTYKVVANGSCTKTSRQYSPGPGAGVAEITVGNWQIVGVGQRQGPRM